MSKYPRNFYTSPLKCGPPYRNSSSGTVGKTLEFTLCEAYKLQGAFLVFNHLNRLIDYWIWCCFALIAYLGDHLNHNHLNTYVGRRPVLPLARKMQIIVHRNIFHNFCKNPQKAHKISVYPRMTRLCSVDTAKIAETSKV